MASGLPTEQTPIVINWTQDKVVAYTELTRHQGFDSIYVLSLGAFSVSVNSIPKQYREILLFAEATYFYAHFITPSSK